MSQPVALWGLPRLADLPPELRKLVRARYGQLNDRASWQRYATIPILFILGLIMVVAMGRLPFLGLGSLIAAPAVGPRIVWIILFAIALPGAFNWISRALVVTPLMRRNYRLALSENGLCPACGYDLRATTGRCPECGAVPKSRTL